jgi:hypothetical protein
VIEGRGERVKERETNKKRDAYMKSSGMYFVVWALWEFLLDFGFLGPSGFVCA